MRRRPMIGVLACSMLATCSVGPDFRAPDAPRLAAYVDLGRGNSAVTPMTNPDPTWWRRFGDPVLDRLVNTAIRQNLTVRQAVLKVIESRQQVVAARAAGLPTLNGTGAYTRQQLGAKGILESKGVYSQLNQLADKAAALDSTVPDFSGRLRTAGDSALSGITQPVDLFQYGLSASWELDLFGRVRRSTEQARAQAEAQQESANDALVTLESEVVQAYLQLRAAQALRKSQQENIGIAQTSLELTDRLRRQGLQTDVQVEQQRTQLLSYQQQLPSYEKQELQAINQLNVLIAEKPGTLDAQLLEPAPLPPLPSVVGTGVPSTLARRRPDVRQAEAQLHAATANVGVAVASFYPDISLTGSLGLRAVDATYLTRWVSHYYSVGPSISLPIFQGGKLAANLKMARAQEAEAALNYLATVLNALREVENALVAYRTDLDARDKTAATVRSAQTSYDLNNSLYRNGLATFITVLDTQRTLVTARQQLVQADITLANDIVALYKSLGGGWEDPGPTSEPPDISDLPPIVPGALDAIADKP